MGGRDLARIVDQSTCGMNLPRISPLRRHLLHLVEGLTIFCRCVLCGDHFDDSVHSQLYFDRLQCQFQFLSPGC